MKIVLAIAAALALSTAPAHAQDVATVSEIFVEKTVTDANGATRVELEKAKTVVPGTPLLFKLTYQNKAGAPVDGYRLTNPIPAAVSFVETRSTGVTYSVDGGQSWGELAALKVKAEDGGLRAAAPADVTHVQFAVAQPIPPGGKGELSFRGVVK